jgi:hypothetical protein
MHENAISHSTRPKMSPGKWACEQIKGTRKDKLSNIFIKLKL